MTDTTPVALASVIVRRQFNDWRTATYRVDDLSDLHWSDVSGGVRARANREYLCGYVFCDAAIEGELAHSCRHGEGPHQIKVCVVKGDNTKATYAGLLACMEEAQASAEGRKRL